MTYKILTLWLAIVLAAVMPSCQDDPIYNPGAIPDGDVEISGEVSFRPLVETVADQSRAGDEGIVLSETVAPKDKAMLAINKLTVLFYDKNRNIVKEYSGPVAYTSNWETRDPDNNKDEASAETQTPCATFKKTVRSGIYYVYAVANLDVDLNAVPTIDDLRSIKLSWTPNSIAQNIEMFGVFTTGDYSQAQNVGFEEDQQLTLTPSTPKIHAWARRAVSKVTIDFDGSQLRNNVVVYIKSARVVDIAGGCYLGKVSKIGGENGFGKTESRHKIVYGPGKDFRKWPYVARGSKKFDRYVVGEDTIKFHNEYAFSLPCYENMQGNGENKYQDKDFDGAVDHPNSGNPNDTIDGKFHKDAMPDGTYLEVEGYYVSSNNDYLSSGPITYRFMLGKNVDNNYDVERNHHYKVTMAFRGNGNDVDWHIEYKEKQPEIYVNDVNASYSYNEKVTIPVRITGGKVQKLEATIIENNWHSEVNVGGNTYFSQKGYSDYMKWETKAGGAAKYNEYFGDIDDGVKQKAYGFLSLYKPHGSVVLPYKNGKSGATYLNGDWQTYAYNHWYWKGKMPNGTKIINGADPVNGGKTIGHRVYTDGQFYENNGNEETLFQVEAYTRQKCLVKNAGYAGANLYETHNRIAKVELVATVNVDGNIQVIKDTVTVNQARRIVNPRGIYRSADNNAPFHVNLKYADVEPTSDENISVGNYLPLKSRGPWRAVIENVGDPGMISLSNTWGDHDSEIDFTVSFNAITKNPSFAIISVYYHNYSCRHRIFVRRGYEPSAVIDGGNKWHAGNVNYRSNSVLYDVKDPIDEGSKFRYANLAYAIAAKNFHSRGYGFSVSIGNNGVLDTREKDDANGNPTYSTVTWGNIKSPAIVDGGPNGKFPRYSLIEAMSVGSGKTPDNNATYADAKKKGEDLLASMTTHPASYDDFYDLYISDDIDYGYGVVYGDDATETASTMEQAYGHDSDNGITDGYGMRCVIVYNNRDARHVIFPLGASGYGHRQADGAMRYAGRAVLMPAGLAETRPVFWNIMYSKGAIYWLAMFDPNSRLPNGSGGYDHATAWDMNYTSYDYYSYSTDATSSGSHAAYIRLVDKP